MMDRKKTILIAILLIWLAPAICTALYRPISIIKSLVESSMATVFSSAYDIATPAGSDSPAEADDRMREIKAAVQERLAVEHRFALTGTEVSASNTGEHTDITTDSIVNAGTMTNTGTLDVTGDFAVNTDKFTVTAASGNALVAGTLDVTGIMTTTAASVLGDGSTLAAATESGDGDRTIADKAFVDAIDSADDMKADNVAGATFGSGSESVTLANGMIMKAGFQADAGAITTVTFGDAFPGGILSVVVTTKDDSPQTTEPVINTVGVSLFKIESNEAVDGYYWWAVGY